MITPTHANKMAEKKINEYLKACHCETNADIENALTMLLSTMGMAAELTLGKSNAIDLFRGVQKNIQLHKMTNGNELKVVK